MVINSRIKFTDKRFVLLEKKIMKKEIKSSEIKEIALNPAYATNDDFQTLEIQGFPVRWMREDEHSDKEIFTLLIDE